MGTDSSARLEIILPAVLPVGECRSSGLGRPRTPTARRAGPVLHVSPVDSRSQQVQSCGSSFPRRHFVCCRWPLTCQSNFLPDAIQSGELERRFLAGALPIEHADFQLCAFRQRPQKLNCIVFVTSRLSIRGHSPMYPNEGLVVDLIFALNFYAISPAPRSP